MDTKMRRYFFIMERSCTQATSGLLGCGMARMRVRVIGARVTPYLVPKPTIQFPLFTFVADCRSARVKSWTIEGKWETTSEREFRGNEMVSG